MHGMQLLERILCRCAKRGRWNKESVSDMSLKIEVNWKAQVAHDFLSPVGNALRPAPGLQLQTALSIFLIVVLVSFTDAVIRGDDATSAELLLRLSPHGERLKLKSTDLQSISEGEIIARNVPTSHPKEMAGFGAMVAEAGPKEFMEAFRSLSVFRQSKSMIACGRFGSEPTLADFDGLLIKGRDLTGLMRVRTKDSDLKLSEADITRIQRIAGPDPHFSNNLIAKVTNEYKTILLEKVKAYASIGSSSIDAYADQPELVDSHGALVRMLGFQLSYAGYGEHLQSVLTAPPRLYDEKIESFYYWAVQKFGQLKPVINIVHVMIFQEETRVLIVSKQIYSSHYTEAGLAIAELLPFKVRQGRIRTLAAYTIRLQVDMFGGAMGFLKRKMAQPHLLETVKEGLQGLRAGVETSHRASVQVREGL